jgi:hypothetical protein
MGAPKEQGWPPFFDLGGSPGISQAEGTAGATTDGLDEGLIILKSPEPSNP